MTLGQSTNLEEIEGMVNGIYFTTYIRELTKIRRSFNLRLSGSRLVKSRQNSVLVIRNAGQQQIFSSTTKPKPE
jgi:hypothetical protein